MSLSGFSGLAIPSLLPWVSTNECARHDALVLGLIEAQSLEGSLQLVRVLGGDQVINGWILVGIPHAGGNHVAVWPLLAALVGFGFTAHLSKS